MGLENHQLYLWLSLMSACWPHFLLLLNDVFPCSIDHGYWQFPGPYFNSLETSEETVSLSHLVLKKFWGRTLESVRCPVFGLLTVIRDWGTKTGLTWAMCPPLLPEAGVLRVCWEVGLGGVEGGISIAEMWPFREELLDNFSKLFNLQARNWNSETIKGCSRLPGHGLPDEMFSAGWKEAYLHLVIGGMQSVRRTQNTLLSTHQPSSRKIS